MTKHKIISESKDGKRMMVVFHHDGESHTRHLRLESGRWMGVALPHHRMSPDKRLMSRNDYTVYGLIAYDFLRDEEGKIALDKRGQATVIEWIPTYEYTAMLQSATTDKAA